MWARSRRSPASPPRPTHTSSTGSRSRTATGCRASSRSSRPRNRAPPRATPRLPAEANRVRWRELNGGIRWLEAELPGARAAFSARTGGVSEGAYESLNLGRLTGDRPEAVRENRHRLAAGLGVDPELVLIGRQVHAAH